MHSKHQSTFLRHCAWLTGSALGGALLAGCGQIVSSGMIDLAPPPMTYAADARTPILGGGSATSVPGEKRAERSSLR